MAFWEAAYGGSQGGNHRLRVQADLIGQEPGNNRSLVRFNAWMESINNHSRVWNYSSTPFTVNRDGSVRSGGFAYDSSSAGQRWYLAQNEDAWVYHDINGNANPYYAASHNANDSPYLTSASAGGNYSLPQINRFTNITEFYVTEVTDVSFKMNTSVDNMANFLQYSLEDGIGWRDQYGGNFYSYGFTVGGNLPSDTPYNLRVRVRRADNNLWTESGVISTRTLAQNGFPNIMGL